MHYSGNPRCSVNDNIYDFDSVFPETPVKNCINGNVVNMPYWLMPTIRQGTNNFFTVILAVFDENLKKSFLKLVVQIVS